MDQLVINSFCLKQQLQLTESFLGLIPEMRNRGTKHAISGRSSASMELHEPNRVTDFGHLSLQDIGRCAVRDEGK